jgi:predicted CXXCH cytochrome family protein
MAKAHQNQLTDKFDCLECHDPHQSDSKKLMRAFLHNPFQEGQCDSCHLPAKDGKIVLTAASTKEVCVMCHEEAAANIQAAPVGHKGAKGECTVCHSPHGSDNAAYIRPDPVTACLDCHKDTAAEVKKLHPHQPASSQSCSICHEPHGGENPKMLRAKSVNQLCLECHGPEAAPKRLEKEHMLAIFDGKVKIPETWAKNMAVLPLKYGQGHPTEHHPVQDILDITTGKVKTPMSCLTCHQAHGSARPGLLAKDQANNMDFCKTCHTNGFNLKDTRTVGK